MEIVEGEKVIIKRLENLKLTCKIDSYPLMRLKWILSNGVEEIINTKNYSSELNILNISTSQNGTFKCCVRENISNCKNVNVFVQGDLAFFLIYQS